MPESTRGSEPAAVSVAIPVAAPRFSVIVPAHGVAGRLSQALDSVLGQSLGAPGRIPLGIEVIPVAGAPDALDGAIAARYARQDPRVRPVVSAPEAGLAGARNAGLAAAGGDYVVFLDGDDTLAPGALAAVAARLVQTGDVDVLYVGHERVHWWKGPQPQDPAGEQLHGAPEGAFAPQAAPWLSGTTLPAWSAVHRRVFLAGHGLTFPAGSYTDTAFGGLELLAASTVAVLHRVCVRHLLRRQGHRLLKEPGAHHFDLLAQVELVLTSARTRTRPHPGAPGAPGAQYGPFTPHPLPDAHRATLFGHLMAQVLKTAAAAPELLPDGDGRVFFERAADLYQYHLPAGFRPPPGRLGVQHRLLAMGSYRAFAALRTAHRQAGRAAGRARARARAAGIPAHLAHLAHRRDPYAAALQRPVDENLAVYCSYWGRGYSCNPAAIHAAARRLAPHLRSVFLVTEEAAGRMPEGVDYAVLGTPRAWELLARAKYLVNNANFANAVVKRPGTVHLQTQHGTPLKKMGIEQAEYPVVAARSGSFRKLLDRVDRWDYNLSANRHSTEVWEREFPADYETLEYGYPRNDVYQTATAADVARIRRELGIPEDRTAILYAPTHRDYRTSFRTQLDLAEFCAAAGEEFVVLLRAHYFYRDGEDRADREGGFHGDGARGGSGPGTPRSRIIDVTGHRSAEEVCLAADALVTDYSSIMFDYANLDRPIVVYADDWDVYRETRGVTFDITAFPPGPFAATGAELARIFRDGSWAGARSAELRARFRERFCPYDDGFAAERVVRRVLLGEPPEALPPVLPPAARTPAPASRPLPTAPSSAPASPAAVQDPAHPAHPAHPAPGSADSGMPDVPSGAAPDAPPRPKTSSPTTPES